MLHSSDVGAQCGGSMEEEERELQQTRSQECVNVVHITSTYLLSKVRRGRSMFLRDNVFVTLVASVQKRAHFEGFEDAFYKLTNPREQIKAHFFD